MKSKRRQVAALQNVDIEMGLSADDLELRRRIVAAFRAARRLSDEQREVYLKKLAADDNVVAGEVRRRLKKDVENRERDTGHGFQYVLHEVIGRGGVGVVYKATQTNLNRTVALKMLANNAFAADAEVERFWRAAEASAQLDHPSIVPILEVGEHNGSRFVAMAYVPGTDLGELLTDGPLAPRRAAELARTIAAAIAFAHARGVIHRDLKPANILLTEDGQPRVADFDLARRLDGDAQLTVTGTVLGTPCYMSPEQAAGTGATAASDVYSLGAILYCMLTGHPPFRAADSLTTLKHVREQEPVPPRQHNPNVPRDIETICLKCLDKSPTRRYGSAAALAQDLDRWLGGKPILARPVGKVERAWRWCRRNPLRVALMLLGAITILGPAASLWYIDRLQKEAKIVSIQHREAEARTLVESAKSKAAEEIARVSQYHALVNRAKVGVDAPTIGWRARGLRDIREARGLKSPVSDVTELRTLAGTCLGGIDLADRRDLARGYHPFCLAFSPDGERLAVGKYLGSSTCSVRIYAVKTARLIKEYSFPSPAEAKKSGVRALTFNTDGTWLIAGTRDGMIHAWNTTNGTSASWHAHDDCVTGLAVRPGEAVLVSCSKDATIKVWDIKVWSTTRTRGTTGGAPSVSDTTAASQQTHVGWTSTSVHGSTITRCERGRETSPHVTLAGDRKWETGGCDRRTWTSIVQECGPGLRRTWTSIVPCLFATLGKTYTLDPVLLHVLKLDKPCGEVHFSADGKLLAYVSFGTTVILDANTLSESPPKVVRKWQEMINQVCFSPDARFLATTGNVPITIRLVAPQGIDFVRTLYDPALVHHSHDDEVSHIEFSRDGSLVVSGAWDQSMKLWDVSSGQLLVSADFHGTGNVFPAFSPVGRDLAVVADEHVILYRLDGFVERTMVAQHPYQVRAATFSPDGQHIACVSCATPNQLASELGSGEMTVWKLSDGERIHGHHVSAAPESLGPEAFALTFHPDGAKLACALRGTPYMWDSGQVKAIPIKTQRQMWLGFSRDGSRFWAALDATLSSWKIADLSKRSEWRNTTERLYGRITLRCAAVFSDGIAVGSSDGFVRLFSNENATAPQRQWQVGDPVYSIAVSPDESVVAVGTLSGMLQLYRFPKGELILRTRNKTAATVPLHREDWVDDRVVLPHAKVRAHANRIDSIAFGPQSESGGLLATASKDGTAHFWKWTADGVEKLMSIRAPSSRPVLSVEFSPDGRALAMLVSNETAVHIWHLDRLRARLEEMGLGW